ncbi:hypothetical protein E7T09_12680 [Deinococcus sp. KSM4-11]|uniref:hypothetical protein n=1 Tax=Deinococcus sp. KSM4-11 TaxID=2568654 RepID=UPI0010A554AE|nr:hypothetical protein [Deinococcus sp. KSM4-11]THF86087.1 hypothetical protein E7T09_12680 [Deinococcus sp. KSM4-11]
MFRIAEAAAHPATETGQETQRLAAQGVPGLVIPPDFEEAYYRGGNLPEQLRRLFSTVNPARIDEDALEPLAARAQALIRTTYLLDDAVQAFYRALGTAGLDVGELHARRPGTLSTESAQVTPPGTAALHAVKRLWAQDWVFDAVLARLDDSGSVALEARPTLLIPGPPGWPDTERAAVLGVPTALVSPLGLVGLP